MANGSDVLLLGASITAMNYLFGSVYYNYNYADLNYDLCFMCSGKKIESNILEEQNKKCG